MPGTSGRPYGEGVALTDDMPVRLQVLLMAKQSTANHSPRKRTSLFQDNFGIAVRNAGLTVETFHAALAKCEPIELDSVRNWYLGQVAYPEKPYRPHIAAILGLASFDDLVAKPIPENRITQADPSPDTADKERRMELVLGGLQASLGATDDQVVAAVKHALKTPEDRIYMRVAVMLVKQALRPA